MSCSGHRQGRRAPVHVASWAWPADPNAAAPHAGLHLSAFVAIATVLACMPIGAVGGTLLLLWLLVLLLPPSTPGTAGDTTSATDAEWQAPAHTFRVHRGATTLLATLAAAHSVGQYLLWVAGRAWLAPATCDVLQSVAGVICGGVGGGDSTASQTVFLSLVASGVTLACLATYRCTPADRLASYLCT